MQFTDARGSENMSQKARKIVGLLIMNRIRFSHLTKIHLHRIVCLKRTKMFQKTNISAPGKTISIEVELSPCQ